MLVGMIDFLRGKLPKNGEWTQKLRLWSGLILFVFALTHFLNHAMGIFSVELMDAVQSVRRPFWRSPLGSILLYGAFIVHVILALWKTLRRETLRMHWWEALQLLLGLAIPYQLLKHIIGTRGLNTMFGMDDTYVQELSILWPGLALNQSILLVLVWAHAMLGFHYWLSGRNWYDKAFPVLSLWALAIPMAALWGWIEGARRLRLTGAIEAGAVKLTREQLTWGTKAIDNVMLGFFTVLLVVTAVLVVRFIFGRVRRNISVEYPGNQVVRSALGPTVLEISRINGIPHTSVCGGRARCSTCRVAILSGGELLEPPSDHEQAVLQRVGAGDEVRLACQIRPKANLSIRPLLPVRDAALKPGSKMDAYHWGVEQPIAVMFVDIRNFTGISEKRLSYDVVFLLNRYLDRMSTAIRDAGGHVDKYIGDGIMAMFGISVDVRTGCRQALEASIAMEQALEVLNLELKDHLEAPLRIGIGLHAGPAILGRIGAAGGKGGASVNLTALGDTVNTASRLESATKELGGMLAVSDAAWKAAGLGDDETLEHHIKVRGRETDMKVFSLESPAIMAEKFKAIDEAVLKKIA